PTETYTLSLHDALPISGEFVFTPALYGEEARPFCDLQEVVAVTVKPYDEDFLQKIEHARNLSPAFIHNCASQIDFTQYDIIGLRSEEHTSELQSRSDLV